MKYINAECRFIDEESEDWLDDPTYWAEDGRRVSINHVFVADWKDVNGSHSHPTNITVASHSHPIS